MPRSASRNLIVILAFQTWNAKTEQGILSWHSKPEMPRSESRNLIPIWAFQTWNAKIRIKESDSALGISKQKSNDRNQEIWFRSWHSNLKCPDRLQGSWFRSWPFKPELPRSESMHLIVISKPRTWLAKIGVKESDSDRGISDLRCQDRNQGSWFGSWDFKPEIAQTGIRDSDSDLGF